MNTKTIVRRALAAVAISATALASTGVGTASAAYTDCPSAYNCFWSGAGFNGSRWQFAGTNPNLSGYGISTQSGYNHGTSGARACGYRYTGYSSLNYSRPQGDTQVYSARPIHSNLWTFSSSCPS